MSSSDTPAATPNSPSTGHSALDESLVKDFKHLGIAIGNNVKTIENQRDHSTRSTTSKPASSLALAAARTVGITNNVELTRNTTETQNNQHVLSLQQPGGTGPAVSAAVAAATTLHGLSKVPVGRDQSTRSKSGSEERERNAQVERPRVEVTNDTTTIMAEPVVQETKHIHHHEIRHEAVQRDVVQHHYVTRILPIVEKVVLPTRHFIETVDGGKIEIPPPALPIVTTSPERPVEDSALQHRDET